MVSLNHGFLFIHIPKTAGNSIQGVLRKYSEDKIVSPAEHQDGVERFEVINERHPKLTKHSTLNDYAEVLGRSELQRLFKFACIRNPWDRMISYYFSPHRGVSQWNRQDFVQLISRTPTMFSTMRLNRRATWLNRFRANRSLTSIDYVMRYEHLADDFKHVCSVLNIPETTLPVRNSSQRKHYSYYYDEELIEMVGKKFRSEIEFGDYSFSDRDCGATSQKTDEQWNQN